MTIEEFEISFIKELTKTSNRKAKIKFSKAIKKLFNLKVKK